MLHGWLKKHCFALLFACPFYAFSTELSVVLVEQSIRLDYPQAARLETVLKDTHAQALLTNMPLESLQAQLFSSDKVALIESQVNQISSQLTALQLQDPDLGAENLLEQIQESQLLYREFTSLDYDVVQSQREGNPLLSGNYQLNIGPRNDSVIFMGAVKKQESVSQRAQWFLADYFKSIGEIRLDSASPSTAWVIQPDGKVVEAHYGIWNFQPHFVAPGAIVYVPFKSLPSEFGSLNHDIVQLLRHKVKNNEQQ
ncbi:capsule biosynthesis GfcC family protein [Vibrio maritimus]|uniref:capsule biosynthesis GfcC family protein n=1 Tax=Vibrio maritimus TaxID=990268 RepID=UPI004068568D